MRAERQEFPRQSGLKRVAFEHYPHHGVSGLLMALGEVGDRAVVHFEGGSFSGRDIGEISKTVASSLADHAAPAGRRFATLLPDHPVTAIALASLVPLTNVLPLNPALTLHELSALVEAASVTAIVAVAGDGLAARLAAQRRLELLHVSLETGAVTLAARGRAEAGRSFPAGLTLLTSGSTGPAKRVPLSEDMLLHSARTIAATLKLGPDDRALHVLPMFHIGALVDLFLAPLIAGGSVAIGRDRTPQSIYAAVRHSRATWLQLVPTMMTRCLEELDEEALRDMGSRLRFIRSVSADLAPALQQSAERLFGAPIIQMYGMTETAGQIASNPLPPAPRKEGSVGLPAGADIAIMDQTGSPLSGAREGEICVRGPAVISAYEDAEDRKEFFGEWLRTGDLGYFDDDGYLFISGRAKDIINRGGEKISVVEIERAALGVDGVQEAVCYGVEHQSLGEQVELAVVRTPGAELDEISLQAALAQILADYKLPRRIRFVAAVPRLGSGKIDRVGLKARPPDQSGEERIYASGAERVVADVWMNILKTRAPLPDDDFFDQGGDSLAGAQFVLLLQARTGLTIEGNLLFETPRFQQIVAAVERLKPVARVESETIRQIRAFTATWPGHRKRPNMLISGLGAIGVRAPLFFCAQGEMEVMGLRNAVHRSRPVYAMRSFFGGINSDNEGEALKLVKTYVAEIQELCPQGPFLLGGFCDGAKLMEMIARELARAGRNPVLFLAIDHWFASPTAFPAIHVWSRHERLSPSGAFINPIRALPILHPAGWRVFQIEADHYAVMDESNFQPLAKVLDAALEEIETTEPLAATITERDRRKLYRASFDVKMERMCSAGGALPVDVAIRNKSARSWPAGMALKVHACSSESKFMMTRQIAKRLAIEEPVEAGGERRFRFDLPFERPGLVRLVFQMDDDGLRSFGFRARASRWLLVRKS